MIIGKEKKENSFIRYNPCRYDLRFENLWIAIGWGLLAAVIIASLVTAPKPIQSISLFHGDKLLHVMVYFVLMGWFAQIYHAPRKRFYYLIGLVLLGALLEWLQGLGGTRLADWLDMVANSVGVLLAWHFTKNRFADLLACFEQKVLS